MRTSQNKKTVQDFFEAGNRGEIERCLELIAEDIRWTDIGTTRFSGTYVGKGELLAGLLEPLFGQLKAGIFSTIENMIAEGDFVVVQSRGEAETLAGEKYNNTYCHVFRVQNQKIREVTEYLDTALTNAVFGA
jgi:ketosteroid isomerase-like protein